jgi:hypothetical protein
MLTLRCWILTVINSFCFMAAVTLLSVLAGGFYAAQHGPLRPDTHGLEVMQGSLLVIVAVQFALTGIATTYLLRGRGMRVEIVFLLLAPFIVTLIVRHVAPEDTVIWLILSNWLVLWRIFVLRYMRQS